MKTYSCPDCGKTFEEGQVPAACPNCGCPSSLFAIKVTNAQALQANVSPSLESSNNFGAEHTANGLAEVIKIVCVFIGIVGGIVAIVFFSKAANGEFLQELDVMIGALSLIFGLIILLIGLISSAFIKLLVNISYRLTRLDNKYNP